MYQIDGMGWLLGNEPDFTRVVLKVAAAPVWKM